VIDSFIEWDTYLDKGLTYDNRVEHSSVFWTERDHLQPVHVSNVDSESDQQHLQHSAERPIWVPALCLAVQARHLSCGHPIRIL
jgi:hypothetical protein